MTDDAAKGHSTILQQAIETLMERRDLDAQDALCVVRWYADESDQPVERAANELTAARLSPPDDELPASSGRSCCGVDMDQVAAPTNWLGGVASRTGQA